MKSISRIVSLCCPIIMAVLHAEIGLSQFQVERQSNIALYGGRWFDGSSFKPLTVYSVRGLFAFKKPDHIDQTLDLKGSWIVPPFGEAHNHNLGTGVTNQERKAVRKYLADGVFYVKIQGNLPLTREDKDRLGLDHSDGPDVAFAQGSVTGTGGHPIGLVESLLRQGYYPGHSPETLKDYRYFTVD